MAQRSMSEAEAAAERALPYVKAALIKAAGGTGYGLVTVDIKKFDPKIEWLNKGREVVDPDPEE